MWLSNGYYHGHVNIRDLWCSEDGVDWTLILDGTPYDPYSEIVVYNGAIYAIKGSVWRSRNGFEWELILDRTPFKAGNYSEAVVHDGRVWHVEVEKFGRRRTASTGNAYVGMRRTGKDLPPQY